MFTIFQRHKNPQQFRSAEFRLGLETYTESYLKVVDTCTWFIFLLNLNSFFDLSLPGSKMSRDISIALSIVFCFWTTSARIKLMDVNKFWSRSHEVTGRMLYRFFLPCFRAIPWKLQWEIPSHRFSRCKMMIFRKGWLHGVRAIEQLPFLK